ncbi:MAG: FliH/SctL family protein [Planctomycetota bacterium]
MPLMKARTSSPAMKEAVVLDLGDVARQAARLRSAAQAQAAQIVDAAEAEARKLIEQAKGQGLEQGLAEGRAQGLEQGRETGRAEALEAVRPALEQMAGAWADVASRWDQGAAELFRDARESALAFALRLGEKVTLRILEVDPTVVKDQVDRALALVFAPSRVSVRVHPEDHAMVAEATPELTQGFAGLQHVELVDDASVGRGGCVVSFGEGEVDAAIHTQIRRIVDAVLPAPEAQAPEQQASLESPAPSESPAPPAPLESAAPTESPASAAVDPTPTAHADANLPAQTAEQAPAGEGVDLHQGPNSDQAADRAPVQDLDPEARLPGASGDALDDDGASPGPIDPRAGDVDPA